MKKIKILSIDGGGIRGIIPGVILTYLEKRLQIKSQTELKIGDFFDFIAGPARVVFYHVFILYLVKMEKRNFQQMMPFSFI